MVLRELNQFTAALASFDAALAARPEHPQALYNRALVLQELKRFNEALATYDRARAIKPDHPAAYGYLDAAAAICDWRRTASVASELANRAEAGINPLGLLALVDDPAFHLRCATRCIEERIPAQSRSSWNRAPFGHDRIRIAYCSPDFRDHPVARLIVELIERHDRARFEIIGI